MEGTPQERLEYRRLPDLPGAEVLLAENCTRNWRVFHETYSVCSLLDLSGARAEWTYRGKTHFSGAGGLMLIEPGEVHANPPRRIPPGNFRALFIAPALAEAAAAELGMRCVRPHLKHAQSSDPALFGAFARFHAALERECGVLELESHFASSLQILLRDCTEGQAPAFAHGTRAGLRRARDLIHEHYQRPIRLDELAATSGLSRYHLVRAFARAFGLPPHAYQVAVQVQKAKSLLAAGQPPVVVAAETGFADQSHLGRHFRRVLGVTPGHYRRS